MQTQMQMQMRKERQTIHLCIHLYTSQYVLSSLPGGMAAYLQACKSDYIENCSYTAASHAIQKLHQGDINDLFFYMRAIINQSTKKSINQPTKRSKRLELYLLLANR